MGVKDGYHGTRQVELAKCMGNHPPVGNNLSHLQRSLILHGCEFPKGMVQKAVVLLPLFPSPLFMA